MSTEPADAVLGLRDITVPRGGRRVVRDSSGLGSAEVQ
jgi:hypothetical protein